MRLAVKANRFAVRFDGKRAVRGALQGALLLAAAALPAAAQEVRLPVLVPLTGCPELTFGRRYRLDSSSQPAGLPPFKEGRQYDILCGKMHDLGGVPDGWEPFLREQVLSLLIEGHSILAFCFAGQGRTGTFLASLVAILEPDVPDPIEAIRHRYSGHAVETRAQAQAIFAIKGMGLPKRWQHLL